jgi:hypothetical protein
MHVVLQRQLNAPTPFPGFLEAFLLKKEDCGTRVQPFFPRLQPLFP